VDGRALATRIVIKSNLLVSGKKRRTEIGLKKKVALQISVALKFGHRPEIGKGGIKRPKREGASVGGNLGKKESVLCLR